MTTKQRNSDLGSPLICFLSACVLLAIGTVALHFGQFRSAAANRGSASSPAVRRANGEFLQTSSPAGSLASRRLLRAYGDLPLRFEANEGQTDPQVKYLARGHGYTLFLTASEAVIKLKFHDASGIKEALQRRTTGLSETKRKRTLRRSRSGQGSLAVLRMQMLGSNRNAAVLASEKLPGKSNYFIGKDANKWLTNVAQYGRVEYRNVYPGVSLAFHGEQQQLEFDYVVAPGADPEHIALRFSGARTLATDASGDLILSSPAGDLGLHKPVAYQEEGGIRRVVPARFVTKAGNQIGFELGSYDHGQELVIDPAISYATYLGGSGEDEGFGIAVDTSGAAYITGETDSPDFPGAAGATNAGSFDAFVTKLSSSGGSIDYTTLIGGSGADAGAAIAVDSSGNAYVTGLTESNDLPVTQGVYQPFFGGGACNSNGTIRTCNDAFVAKLTPSGAITYLTYLGSNNDDNPIGIAIDGSGDTYVAGQTFSNPFPGTSQSPIQAVFNLGESNTASDGFVTEFNPDATALVYSTYLGGGANDLVYGIAVDSSGNAYVTGDTVSTDFPITDGAFQTKCGTDGNCNSNADDAFVSKINAGGTAIVYSTYLGGSGVDAGLAIAIDASRSAYITGFTASTDFPLHAPFQRQLLSSNGNAFVTKLNPSGSGLDYSSFLGGSTFDAAVSIALDHSTNAYLTGTTQSVDFPTVDALQPALNGDSDAFITEVNSTGATKVYSTFLGGSGDENYDATSGNPFGGAIAVVPTSGAAYVTGATTSTDFPTTALQAKSGGGTADAFAAGITAPPSGPDFSVGVDPATVAVTSGKTTGNINVTVTPLNGSFTSAVTLACGGLPTDAACTFSATSVTPGSKQATSTLTISTNGTKGNGLLSPPSLRRSGWFYAMLLPVGGIALFGAGFAATSRNRKRLFLVCLALLGLMFLASCSTSSKGGGGGGSGDTPTGNYEISITGASGSTNHTAGLVLSVQ